MAQSKNEDSAEKAYAEASSAVKPAKGKPLVESLKADAAGNKPAAEEKKVEEKAPVKREAPAANADAAPAAKKAPAKKATAKKTVSKKTPAKKAPAKKAAPAKVAAKKSAPKTVRKPAKKTATKSAVKPAKAPIAAQTETKKLKEIIMATKTNDYTTVMTDTMTDAVSEMQTRAQAAYDKGTATVADMTELAKGNVEAVVESGKIMAEGMQSMGKTYADEAKSAYETVQADLKEMASVKSPTELFQLQGKIFRRNFDAMVSVTSKNTDAAMKLANDAMAPLSGRMNVAAEKLSKVA